MLKTKIQAFLQQQAPEPEKALALFQEVVAALEAGTLRVAEKVAGVWVVNSWLKEAILWGFKYGKLAMSELAGYPYCDKASLGLRRLTLADNIRMVPLGSAIRAGAYLAPGTIVMPPAYINIGAYVDSGSMIDSHALVGSCAQIGKNVHIAAAAQIGGVLEPSGAVPVIIEDGAFIGGNCGIYEGVLVKAGAVLASGVILTGATPVFDATTGTFLRRSAAQPLTIPENAVVVPGSRPMSTESGKQHKIQLYCPVLVKYKDAKTSAAVALEACLR